jgi:hypothetical protein
MALGDYFETHKGLGVLATADAEGRVDAAIYARPHVMEDGTVVFIMADRTTHDNLQSNPHAAYLFVEDGKGYTGKRLFLTKVSDEKNSELIEKLRRRKYAELKGEDEFLVCFKVDKIVPLIGPGKKE